VGRPAHLDYLKSTGKLVAAGPIFDVDKTDGDPVGSMVMFNADTHEEREAFIHGDPYYKAGLFDSVFTSQLARLDVTGQHYDPYFDEFTSVNPPEYDPVHDRMMELGLATKKEPRK